MTVPGVAIQRPLTTKLRSLRAAFGLSRERFAPLLGTTAKSIERWEARDIPTAQDLARGRLAQLQRIAELGQSVYTPRGLHEFISMPLPVFDGRTALQLIQQGQADQVVAALASDYEGGIA